MALTRWFAAICIAFAVLLADPMARAQPADAALNLPDDPVASPLSKHRPSSPTATPAPHSDSQTSPAQAAGTPTPEESERQKAQEQLDKQLHQRVFGVMATFNTTSNRDALPLSTRPEVPALFQERQRPVALRAHGCWCGHRSGRKQLSRVRPGGGRVRQAMGCGLHRLLYRQSAGQCGVGKPVAEKIRAISRRAQAASPAVLCGRPAERCGASAITAPGDRTMQMSWAI